MTENGAMLQLRPDPLDFQITGRAAVGVPAAGQAQTSVCPQ
jgi:hypothetical protein